MKTSFVLYTEYLRHMQLLTMEQRGVLFTAIMAYEGETEMPEMDGAVEMAFSFIRVQLERDEEKYAEVSKKRSEARKAADKGKQGEQSPSPRSDVKQSKSTSYKARQTGSGVYREEQFVSNNDNACQTSEEADKAEEDAASDDNFGQGMTNGDKREQDVTNVGKSNQTASNGCVYEDEDVDEDGILYPSSLPQARAREETLSSFLAQNKLVVLDVSPADPSVFDFTELCAAFRESDYLKNRRHEFSWVMRCYEAILRGEYRDNAPVKGRKSKMQAVYTALKAKYEQEEQYAAYN